MFWFLAVPLLVIGIVAFAVSFYTPREVRSGYDTSHPRKYTRIGSTIALVLGLLFALWSSTAVVQTKNVGVLTTFGRPSGYLSNGLHLKAPWAKVIELNDAINTDTYASDGGAGGKTQQGATGSCVNVRIAQQGNACANVSIRWQIKPDAVDYLFRNYKDNAAIQDNLVLRDLQTAMNENLASYNPLGIDANGNSTNEPLSSPTSSTKNYSTDVQNQMESEIGQYIDVLQVNIPILNFDSSTQSRVNQLQQQYALTKVAVAALGTAQAQAAANAAIQSSLSQDPNVLIYQCLQIVSDVEKDGKAGVLPAGFSCFGSSTPIAVTK